MTKVEQIQDDLLPLLESFFESGKSSRLESYIVANRNLPSPRANLELAYALSGLLDEIKKKDLAKLFSLFIEWGSISSKQAPVNDPKEFLPFCAARAIGKIGSIEEKFRPKAVNLLRDYSKDNRWRMREAVTMGLQFLLDKYPQQMVDQFNIWIKDENFLELRAVVTAYADPALLTRKVISQNGLKTHRKVLDIVHASEDRKSDEFKALRKALGYTFSLIATIYTPNSFGVMKKLAATGDKDLQWIVRENMKKKRLITKFPDKVKEVEKLLDKMKG